MAPRANNDPGRASGALIAADGVEENRMPAMTSEMVMMHTGLRREFGFMPELARGVFEGDRRRAGVVAGHIELIWSVLDNHHKGEDTVIWPRLLERCPVEILPLVHAMEGHHESITTLGGELTKHAAAWRTDASVSHREAVLHTLDLLLPVLRERLKMEELYVLPLIESTSRPPSGPAWSPTAPRVSRHRRSR
jgi:hemerythrin-like domain-containing protein